MSLETSIAALTTQAGLLMDLPNQVNAAAQAKIAAMGAAYQGHIAGLAVTAYVDQVNGLDTNSGAIGSPFRTIDKALALTPRGGLCTVILKSAYTLSAHVIIDGKDLVLQSDSAVRRALTFERLLDTSTTPAYRYAASLQLVNGGGITIHGLTINVPVVDGNWVNYVAAGVPGGLISAMGWMTFGGYKVSLASCDVNIPASPFCAVVQGGIGITSLNVHSLSYTGAITSPNGRLWGGQTNTAGVATNTLSSLATNLTTI